MFDYDYPEYVIEAFGLAYGEQVEELIEEFVGRWGNLDIETFVRVLQEGQGEEKVLAIFAISYAALPHSQVRELLLPFLRSAELRERWASAECLGRIREEEALPVLIDLLEEGLTPQWRQREWSWYEDIRAYIPLTLGEWGDASLVPVLRHALHTVWEMEQQIARSYPTWRRYQAMLSWALGYYGCFGALTGLSLPEERLSLTMLHLAWGHLQATTGSSYQPLFTVLIQKKDPVVKQALMKVLEQQFGLSEQESLVCLKQGHLE